jgi:hypothetical protein
MRVPTVHKLARISPVLNLKVLRRTLGLLLIRRFVNNHQHQILLSADNPVPWGHDLHHKLMLRTSAKSHSRPHKLGHLNPDLHRFGLRPARVKSQPAHQDLCRMAHHNQLHCRTVLDDLKGHNLPGYRRVQHKLVSGYRVQHHHRLFKRALHSPEHRLEQHKLVPGYQVQHHLRLFR